MIYSYRIEQALRAAAVLHQDQVRKGRIPIPYVTHLYAVAFLVADYTQNENAVIAALLHDTLEDTDYTSEELKNDFGEEVTKLVIAVSEHQGKTEKKEMTWKERKEKYVRQLDKADEYALVIAAADKIHNFRSTIEEYYERSERYIKDFGSDLREKLLMYQEISNVLNRRLKNDIIHEFNHVWSEYKNFIANVEKETSIRL
jgi:(p)ppGpp synthase/HD superfamily hydrolase